VQTHAEQAGVAQPRAGQPAAGRADKVVLLAQAIAEHVRDGMTVALEGFSHLIPFSAGHEIIRQRRRGLTCGLPFFPVRSYAGSDLPRLNPHIRLVDNPYGEDQVYVVPPLRPDVTVIHAQRADRHGNVQIWGILGAQQEAVYAAERAIVVVEEVVDPEVIRADPNRTLLPGHAVDAVVHLPRGAHPSYAQGCYDRDGAFYREWTATGSGRLPGVDGDQQGPRAAAGLALGVGARRPRPRRLPAQAREGPLEDRRGGPAAVRAGRLRQAAAVTAASDRPSAVSPSSTEFLATVAARALAGKLRVCSGARTGSGSCSSPASTPGSRSGRSGRPPDGTCRSRTRSR
jgi:acyl CoA:acetate/3-ketoacid CoA transferase alpha subunit